MSPRAAFLLGLLAGIAATGALVVLVPDAARPVADRAAGGGRRPDGPPASPLEEVLARLHADYVDPVDVDALEAAAATDVVQRVDRFSRYLDAQAYAQMKADAKGAYVGIGVELREAPEGIVVSHVFPGSPAALAGVRLRDRLLQVDDRGLETPGLASAGQALRGPPGSWVVLQLVRAGLAQPLVLRIQRADIHVDTVTALPLGNAAAYLRIARFTTQTPTEFVAALRRLAGEDPVPLRRLVLDLRGNPGGVLESAVAVADALLGAGVIVTAEGRRRDAAYRAEARPGDLLEDTAIAVLVNAGTASAAEILAAALRDNGRAAVLGRTTFGKGSVQSLLPLGRGDALLLTTARYLTPRGDSLHGRGLQPDAVVDAAAADPDPALGPDRDPAVAAALDRLAAPAPHLP